MLLNSKQFILTSASRQLIGSLHFMTTSTKVNSFTILKTKNQFILLCWKKQLWRMCTNFWINPHNGKLPSRLAPAQCQNSLAPQLLSNINQSKSSLLIWHYVSYLFLLFLFFSRFSLSVLTFLLLLWVTSIKKHTCYQVDLVFNRYWM